VTRACSEPVFIDGRSDIRLHKRKRSARTLVSNVLGLANHRVGIHLRGEGSLSHGMSSVKTGLLLITALLQSAIQSYVCHVLQMVRDLVGLFVWLAGGCRTVRAAPTYEALPPGSNDLNFPC